MMFCSECGTKVNDGAKFCFNCGAKIDGGQEHIQKVEKQNKPEHMTTFELYGETLAFSDEECLGIEIGKVYRDLYSDIRKEMVSFYNNSITERTKEGYWDSFNKKVLELIDGVYNEAVLRLEDEDVSEDDIAKIDYMGIYKFWLPVFEKTDYEYNLICLGAEGAEYYRKLRKDTRGRFIGGGFGLEGAAKGIATAGVLNLATGAAHSAFNFVGNLKDDLKRKRKIEQLFDKEFAETVLVILRNTVEMLYLTELAVLEANGELGKVYKLFYDVNGDEEKSIKINMFKETPFDESLYYSAIMQKGDEANQLEFFAEFVGINLCVMKESYIETQFSNIKFDESNVDEYINNIKKTKKELGISSEISIETKIIKIKQNIDEEKICVYEPDISSEIRWRSKPKIINGTKIMYNDSKMLEVVRVKREEIISIYTEMDTDDFKSLEETVDKIQTIYSEYGIGKTLLDKINKYILTRVVTSDMHIGRDGFIKREQIATYQCQSIAEWRRIFHLWKEIEEKYGCTNIDKYSAYKIFRELKNLLKDENWGAYLLHQIYSRIDWSYTIKDVSEILRDEELYKDIVWGSDENASDLQELMLEVKENTIKLNVGKTKMYSNLKEAVEVQQFNQMVSTIVPLIRTYDTEWYAITIKIILKNVPNCLKECQWVEDLKQRLDDIKFEHENEEKSENKKDNPNLCTEQTISKQPQNNINVEWKEKYALAVSYEEGIEKKQDFISAVKIYEELAEYGMPEAQWRLARCYKGGLGTGKNIEKAIELFTKAAEQGVPEAMGALGDLYSTVNSGPEYPKDNEKAEYWYNKSAELGNLVAQFNLSIFYEEAKTDYNKGLHWLIKAAENGQENACFNLGVRYYLGKEGIKQDYVQATYWWEKAANAGHAKAQHNLAKAYFNGTGVETSHEKAEYWYTKAAEQGYEPSKNELKKFKNGCYITTAVCKSFNKPDDCYELQSFRRFRDEWLAYQDDGEKLIKEYYNTAPEIVAKVDVRKDAKEIYRYIWVTYLKVCLSYIEEQKYELCKNLYVDMVNYMKENYL